MSASTSKETPSTTRAKTEQSKQMWECLNTLIEESFENIEAWVKDTAFPASQVLANLLGGDLTSHENLWTTMEQKYQQYRVPD